MLFERVAYPRRSSSITRPSTREAESPRVSVSSSCFGPVRSFSDTYPRTPVGSSTSVVPQAYMHRGWGLWVMTSTSSTLFLDMSNR